MLPNPNVVDRYLYTVGSYIPPMIGQGDCVTYNPATGLFGPLDQRLDENNVAWRVVADWTPNNTTLVYASVSKGYKVGNIPIVAANLAQQEVPAKQERLLS